jgi:ClpP class serine protease
MNENKTFDPVSYIFGRTQFFIEVYAASNGLSQDELTAGLATLLFASQSGKVLGTVDNLSTLRRPSAKVDTSTRKVAVARNAHRKTQVEERSTKRESIHTRDGFGGPPGSNRAKGNR